MGVFSLTRWSWQIHARFLVSRVTRVSFSTRSMIFIYRAITFYGWTFHSILLINDFLTCRTVCNRLQNDPTTPLAQYLQVWHVNGLGFSPFARRYLGNLFWFLFLELLRCVSSLRCLYPSYVFRWEWLGITRAGLPHSEIPGFKVVCTYPRLIAAYHVLHRLHVPRHPPYALSNFIKVISSYNEATYVISKLSKSKKILWS